MFECLGEKNAQQHLIDALKQIIGILKFIKLIKITDINEGKAKSSIKKNTILYLQHTQS